MTTYNLVDMVDLSQCAKFGRNLTRHSRQVKFIMLHHSASNRLTWEQLKALHCGQLHKWPSIGYHYFVRKDGYVYKCNDWNRVVNGCKDFNTPTIHVCFEGNYMYDEFMHNLNDVLGLVMRDLDSKIRIEDILLHSHKKNTECPGINLVKSYDAYMADKIAKQSLIWPELES